MKQDDVRLAESKKLMRSAVLECKVMGMTEEQVTGIVKELYKEMSVC